MKIKYLVVRGEFGREEMIVFSETMHYSHLLRDTLVISEGFIRFRYVDGKLKLGVYGDEKSRPEEDIKLAKQLFNAA